MKLIANGRMPHGKNYLAEGDEFDEENEGLAQLLVQSGAARQGSGAASKKARTRKVMEPEVLEASAQSYETRDMSAE